MTAGLIEIVTQVLNLVETDFEELCHLCGGSYAYAAAYEFLLASRVLVPTDDGPKIAEQSPIGFHLNEAPTKRDSHKIVFANVTVGGEGPATSIHQFYSVAEAKDLVHQLLIAIAQAEGSSTDEG